MPATIKLTRRSIGIEVRRGAFDVLVDGNQVASLEMDDTIEMQVEPGRHTLQLRNGRTRAAPRPSTPQTGR